MSADKHTPVSTAVSTASLYVRSYANRDLGIFLIFFGIVAAVPLYALIMNIVFKQAVIQWRIGIIIGLVSIILGCLLIKYSKLRFKVTRKNDGSGTISIQEGLLRSPLLYDFASSSIIKLATANTDAGSKKGELIQVTLIDGNRHYLLDSRPLNKMQESRAIAEFFSKNGSLKMLLPHYGNLMLESTDLDLPFSARVKKYPTLIGLEPTRPQNCPINTTELNGGIDRRYSWGFRANGLVFQLIALLMVAFAFSCLPLFEEARVPVIRLGLNPTEELSSCEAAAGAYHPALGELVKSRMLLHRAEEVLQGIPSGSHVRIGIAPRQLSQMIGQHGENRRKLIETFSLASLRFVPIEGCLLPRVLSTEDQSPPPGGQIMQKSV